MFAWIGTQFDKVLNTYVVDVVAALMNAMAPIALTATTLWVALYGWAVLRNAVPETLPTFVWKVFKISLVLALALQSGLYLSTIADTANAVATGVATTFLPATASPLAVSSPYGLLDSFNDKASQLVVDLLKEAGITRLDLVFAAVVTALGNVLFLCLALFVVTLAKVVLTFTIAVGPLFVLCLAWQPTARFFDSWLSMLLNAVVLTWFAFFALGLSASMGDALVQVIEDQGGFNGPTFNVVAESLKYCIVMVLMAIVCLQAPSLASALTGGVAVQQGLQIVQNLMVVSGLRSAPGARSRGSDGWGKPGQSAQAGTRSPAPQGPAATRTAAFRLAAQRGGA
ncbi:MAG: type IV secretion system protein [Burkholderiales bacterium]|nr:type IV secretion system protein [Burkholderiales bacterium]